MDALIVLLYLVGFVVSIIVVFAVCQLFAIRRLLEQLVQQSGPAPSPAAPVPSPAPAVQFRETADELAARKKKDQIAWVLLGAMVIVGIALLVLGRLGAFG